MTPLDLNDGFMHASTAAQAAPVLQRFYPTHEIMHLIKIPVKGAFKDKSRWDPASNGELYLHLYGEIEVKAEDGWTLHEVRRSEGQEWAKALEGLEWLEA